MKNFSRRKNVWSPLENREASNVISDGILHDVKEEIQELEKNAKKLSDALMKKLLTLSASAMLISLSAFSVVQHISPDMVVDSTHIGIATPLVESFVEELKESASIYRQAGINARALALEADIEPVLEYFKDIIANFVSSFINLYNYLSEEVSR